MAQRTVVLKLESHEQDRLREAVERADYHLRSVEHAHFSARGEGVVATLYRSGKLVVQGAGAELFVERFLEGARGPVGETPGERTDRTLIGGDESGKGDFFGPLVVAAVRLGPGDAAQLRRGGVGDSKKVADSTILRLAPALRESFPHAVRTLDPPEYNRRHGEEGNVALILASLYREVVEEIASPGTHVLIDQFSKDPKRLTSAFEGLDVRLEQRHHAEDAMAVAAASFLAREAFVRRLSELADEHAVDLPKGAGPPVIAAARAVIRIHGFEKLGRVAKTHFKTTQRLGEVR